MPEKPDGYELKLPADLTFGDGEGFELNPDDPMVAFGREVAHAAGLDQSGFEKLVGMYAQREVASAKEREAAIAAQLEALGPKAAERKSAVETFLAAKLGKDAPTLFGSVTMFQGRHRKHREADAPRLRWRWRFSQQGREGGQRRPTEEEYAAMSPAERLVAARQKRAGGR